jgi:hypothetical protein
VYSLKTQKEAARLFREINQAEPVKLVDIPEDEEFEGSVGLSVDNDGASAGESSGSGSGSGSSSGSGNDSGNDSDAATVASSRVLKKEIIDGAVNELVKEYPAMFKPSSRCRKPHLNIDNLRDELYQSNIIETRGLTTERELYQWMEMRNQELQDKEIKEWYSGATTITPAMKKAYEKSQTHSFFLGMGYGWLYV